VDESCVLCAVCCVLCVVVYPHTVQYVFMGLNDERLSVIVVFTFTGCPSVRVIS